jgi:hypothetical protein
LISHNGSFCRIYLLALESEHIVNNMALQAASAQLEVAAGYASDRIWAEDAETRCGMLGDDVRPN